ncbi:hypothetical protein V1478_013358 [Vespula squamosa]|uniref:Uncharacterized protein n=1 Tax=Vespula squamosa TaxID=30214 RepID=A0ABD2AAL3_VESSQ
MARKSRPMLATKVSNRDKYVASLKRALLSLAYARSRKQECPSAKTGSDLSIKTFTQIDFKSDNGQNEDEIFEKRPLEKVSTKRKNSILHFLFSIGNIVDSNSWLPKAFLTLLVPGYRYIDYTLSPSRAQNRNIISPKYRFASHELDWWPRLSGVENGVVEDSSTLRIFARADKKEESPFPITAKREFIRNSVMKKTVGVLYHQRKE